MNGIPARYFETRLMRHGMHVYRLLCAMWHNAGKCTELAMQVLPGGMHCYNNNRKASHHFGLLGFVVLPSIHLWFVSTIMVCVEIYVYIMHEAFVNVINRLALSSTAYMVI